MGGQRRTRATSKEPTSKNVRSNSRASRATVSPDPEELSRGTRSSSRDHTAVPTRQSARLRGQSAEPVSLPDTEKRKPKKVPKASPTKQNEHDEEDHDSEPISNKRKRGREQDHTPTMVLDTIEEVDTPSPNKRRKKGTGNRRSVSPLGTEQEGLPLEPSSPSSLPHSAEPETPPLNQSPPSPPSPSAEPNSAPSTPGLDTIDEVDTTMDANIPEEVDTSQEAEIFEEVDICEEIDVSQEVDTSEEANISEGVNIFKEVDISEEIRASVEINTYEEVNMSEEVTTSSPSKKQKLENDSGPSLPACSVEPDHAPSTPNTVTTEEVNTPPPSKRRKLENGFNSSPSPILQRTTTPKTPQGPSNRIFGWFSRLTRSTRRPTQPQVDTSSISPAVASAVQHEKPTSPCPSQPQNDATSTSQATGGIEDELSVDEQHITPFPSHSKGDASSSSSVAASVVERDEINALSSQPQSDIDSTSQVIGSVDPEEPTLLSCTQPQSGIDSTSQVTNSVEDDQLPIQPQSGINSTPQAGSSVQHDQPTIISTTHSNANAKSVGSRQPIRPIKTHRRLPSFDPDDLDDVPLILEEQAKICRELGWKYPYDDPPKPRATEIVLDLLNLYKDVQDGRDVDSTKIIDALKQHQKQPSTSHDLTSVQSKPNVQPSTNDNTVRTNTTSASNNTPRTPHAYRNASSHHDPNAVLGSRVSKSVSHQSNTTMHPTIAEGLASMTWRLRPSSIITPRTYAGPISEPSQGSSSRHVSGASSLRGSQRLHTAIDSEDSQRAKKSRFSTSVPGPTSRTASSSGTSRNTSASSARPSSFSTSRGLRSSSDVPASTNTTRFLATTANSSGTSHNASTASTRPSAFGTSRGLCPSADSTNVPAPTNTTELMATTTSSSSKPRSSFADRHPDAFGTPRSKPLNGLRRSPTGVERPVSRGGILKTKSRKIKRVRKVRTVKHINERNAYQFGDFLMGPWVTDVRKGAELEVDEYYYVDEEYTHDEQLYSPRFVDQVCATAYQPRYKEEDVCSECSDSEEEEVGSNEVEENKNVDSVEKDKNVDLAEEDKNEAESNILAASPQASNRFKFSTLYERRPEFIRIQKYFARYEGEDLDISEHIRQAVWNLPESELPPPEDQDVAELDRLCKEAWKENRGLWRQARGDDP